MRSVSLNVLTKEADRGNAHTNAAWVVWRLKWFQWEERPRCLSVKLVLPPAEREMDQNEEVVQTSGSKTLLVRHLPEELSQDEKEDLLKYFGAQSVRVFSNRGRMVSNVAS